MLIEIQILPEMNFEMISRLICKFIFVSFQILDKSTAVFIPDIDPLTLDQNMFIMFYTRTSEEMMKVNTSPVFRICKFKIHTQNMRYYLLVLCNL